MNITFGKQKGKTVENLVLKEPEYIHWMLGVNATGALLRIQEHANLLISMFNSKPLLRRCAGSNCQAAASRVTVYMDNIFSPYWWCDNCDPYQQGANEGKLHVIRTYEDALNHVALYCRGRKEDFREIIKMLAVTKGLPARSGNKECDAFFAV